MKLLFMLYRVLATVVGCSIILLILVGVPLQFMHKLWPGAAPVGSHLYEFGDNLNLYLGTAHGFIYMGFLLVAFVLGLQARWSFGFLIVTLACGTIPILSFWAELRAIRRLQREHPVELGLAPEPVAGPEASSSAEV